MKRKRILVLFSVCASVFLSAGCTTKYEQSDIIDYVAREYGLKNFQVSERCQEVEDDEGYTDHLWTVSLQDGSGISFCVMDDYGWGMESVYNHLDCDYEDHMLLHLTKDYTKFHKLQIITEEKNGMTHTSLYGQYENRSELIALFQEALAFKEYAAENDYVRKNSFSVRFAMASPLRSIMESDEKRLSYVLDDADYMAHITSLQAEELEAAIKKYICTCADYRFNNKLSDFTKEEISNAIKETKYQIAVCRPDMEPEAYRTLEGLSASLYNYGVSFGCLYEILKEENFPVSGNVWHYQFTGSDGSVYEISYNFYAYNEEEPDAANYYYYIKDGERIWMPAYFYNHFSKSAVEEMTGLKIYIGD